MKKLILYLIILVVLLGIIFFFIDFKRCKKGQSPIFCICYATLKDGGTKEYIGMGYKVIEYPVKISGHKYIEIGTVFLKYNRSIVEEFLKPKPIQLNN